MRLLFAAIVLVAGCGEDPDETCKPEGFSDGESVIEGAPLGPFARAALTRPERTSAAFALALDEGDGACGLPGPGRRISILFCTTPEPFTYEIASTLTFRCPSDTVLAILEDEAGNDLAEALEGRVQVTHAGGCVSGTYELQLGTGLLAGSFDAVVCPDED